MEAWVWITLAAAFFQNARSALQKRLQAPLSTLGSAYARFVFATPFALAYAVGAVAATGTPVPTPTGGFVVWAALGGLAQIAATVLLLAAFRHRSFAVATAYSKTDSVQTAVAGTVLIGDRLTALSTLGVVVGMLGVLLLAGARTGRRLGGFLAFWRDPAALLGIASGAGFAVAAVGYRAGALALGLDSAYAAAAVTLAAVTLFQTLVMGAWLMAVRPGLVGAVLGAWRATLPVGLMGMLASAGWFTAMTLEPAAHVRALGQVELLFSVAASLFLFKERARPLEVGAVALLIAGIAFLLLGT